MKKVTKKDTQEIKNRLIERYGSATTELHYRNDFELLIAISLSAQCTDKRVNLITPALFEAYPNPQTLADANINHVKSLINTCSFFNNKAENIIKMAQQVCTRHNGTIPHDENALKNLAGVGQKTAHVFMIEALGHNLMAVDTHVFRTSHRLGLSQSLTPAKTEEDLVKLFKTDLSILHQGLVLFGRYICTAKNPKCDECFLPEFCKTKESFKPR